MSVRQLASSRTTECNVSKPEETFVEIEIRKKGRKMELVSKPNATASVWEHFGFKPNERGEPLNLCEPVCRICSRTVATKHGNTTNMHLHLKHNHPMQFSQLGKTTTTNKPRQCTIIGAFNRQTKYKQVSAKWCALTDSVVRLIAKEMLPFNIVEKPAFRKMLQTFDSQYELPGKTYVSQTAIPQLYNSIKDEILTEIKDIPFYSATTDMWSSSNMTPYMSLTIHYITAAFALFVYKGPNWQFSLFSLSEPNILRVILFTETS